MIDLYTWATPNGRKVSIMLEECGLSYRAIPVDIGKGEQNTPEFTALNPYNKIPVIVDREQGCSLMESGAILLYLAQRSGRFLAPQDSSDYWEQMQWLMFQMGNAGPMLGQCHHFVKFNPGKSPYAEQRYRDETRRVYATLERRLHDRRYLAGDYSIADMATWPWISRYEFQQMNLREYPALLRWYLDIAARPAVQRGYRVPQDLPVPIPA